MPTWGGRKVAALRAQWAAIIATGTGQEFLHFVRDDQCHLVPIHAKDVSPFRYDGGMQTKPVKRLVLANEIRP